MSGDARGATGRRVTFVLRQRQHERPRPPAAAGTPNAPPGLPSPLLSSFELQATASYFAACFVDEQFEKDISQPDLDAPQGTPVPRRRLTRAARPFSLAAAIRGAASASDAPTTTAPHDGWPSAIAAYTRKGYLRGDPGFKPQNQDRAFAVVVAASSSNSGRGDDGKSPPPPPPPPLLLLGVCDGHGSDGHHVSDWLARDFPRLLAQRLLEPRGQQQEQDAPTNTRRRPPLLPLPFGRSSSSSSPVPAEDTSTAATALARPLPPLAPAELARWRAAFDDGDRLLPERCAGGPQRVIDSGSTLCAVCVRSSSSSSSSSSHGGAQGQGQGQAASVELTAGWVGDSRAAVGGWRPPPPPRLRPGRALVNFPSGPTAAAAAEAAAALAPHVAQLTDDHKPERSDERARVLLFGGRVEPMRVGPPPGVYAGPFRVWCPGRRDYPGLAMSRAFGDLGARPAGVVSEPEVRRWRLEAAGTRAGSSASASASSSAAAASSSPSSSSSSRPPLLSSAVQPLLIVASDGVFEYLENEEAVGAAAAGAERAAARGATRDEAAAAAARALVDAAERRWARDGSGGGYCDDITAVVALWG